MTALGTAGGATATNTGALTYSGRTFKDFHLQLKYRAAATSNNGGVLLPGGAPGRDPRQRDRGHPHGRDRRARTQRVRAGQAGARVEHARRDRLRRPRQLAASTASRSPAATVPGATGSIGLENAGNNLMYADVRIKELTTDTTAPTITIRNVPDGRDPAPGHAVHRRLRVRRRAGSRRVHGDADRRRHARPLHVQGHRQGRRRQRDGRDPRVHRRRLHQRDRLGRRHRPGDARAHARARRPRSAPSRPGVGQGLHRVHDRDRRQHRRRRDADVGVCRPRPPDERSVRAAGAAAGRELSKSTWAAPTSNDLVAIALQAVRDGPPTPCGPAATARPSRSRSRRPRPRGIR